MLQDQDAAIAYLHVFVLRELGIWLLLRGRRWSPKGQELRWLRRSSTLHSSLSSLSRWLSGRFSIFAMSGSCRLAVFRSRLAKCNRVRVARAARPGSRKALG